MKSSTTTAFSSLFLDPVPQAGTITVNSHCVVFTQDDLCLVEVMRVSVLSFGRNDPGALPYFLAIAQRLDWASAQELAQAFDLSLRTVQRYKERYLKEGFKGLYRKSGGGRPASLGAAQDAVIKKLYEMGDGLETIATKLAVTRNTVKSALTRLGISIRPQGRPASQLAMAFEREETPTPHSEEPIEPVEAAATGHDEPVAGHNEPVVEAAVEALVVEAVAGHNEPVVEAAVEAVAGHSEPIVEALVVEAVAGYNEPVVEAVAGPIVGCDELVVEAIPAADAPIPGHYEFEDHGISEPVKADKQNLPMKATLPPLAVIHLAAPSMDTDPSDRVIDRFLATQGLLFDAVPFFQPGRGIPFVGFLLAIPMLVASGIIQEAERLYPAFGPAFYGLRTTLMVLAAMALLRITRPENLKEHSPPDLGRILGLDRAPEAATIRRRLDQLAAGKSESLLEAVIQRRIQSRQEALGYLYFDGHVRVYHGKANLPKTHVAQMRICMPATQDAWINDASGRPLFFVTQEAHPSLSDAIRNLMSDLQDCIGKQRVTFVFDRGGWSPDFFADLAERADVITYRKGNVDPLPNGAFSEHIVPAREKETKWELADSEVKVGKCRFPMRQVTLRKNGHQVHIVTTRRDISAVEVAVRMFYRWRQENFFKYMREEFEFDALIEYAAEEDDPERTAPNKAWNALDQELRKPVADLKLLEEALGAGVQSEDGPLRAAREKVEDIRGRRDALPKRIKVSESPHPTDRLPARKKRLYDGIKIIAYEIETDLVRLVTPFYRRVLDEGRTLISTAIRSSGDIDISDGILHVTLAPQSSPHRSRAIEEVCHLLNDTKTFFPGTTLRLEYRVRGVDRDR